jgi:hypothetical protein
MTNARNKTALACPGTAEQSSNTMSETVFNKVDYTLASLLGEIELGQIGLPDIQRPFVWTNSKVRDLFDSIYRGYPVGYFLFWQSVAPGGARQIGIGSKQVSPSLLIVDGQQRLTALFAVTRGVEVVREDYSRERIEISFSPLDGTFEVADAATRRDPRFIPSISALWAKNADLFQIANEYVEGLRDSRTAGGETLSSTEVQKVQRAIQRLANLTSYPFTALVLFPTIDEEQVGEVFVRINSQGKSLNQSDFILTLMSVFWDEGRTALEEFCRQSRQPSRTRGTPHNNFIDPIPDQLLRVAVGLGFRRARLKNVYSLLRGKDLETGEFSPAQRQAQFEVLRAAQAEVLDTQHWHDFLSILPIAGFRSGAYISSLNALLMAYILYLIGRIHYKVDPFVLKQMIAQWFFMSSLTARYTGGSPETAMERDLGALRELKTSKQFVDWMQGNIQVELTNDFWSITLPNRLKTSAARSPTLFAYYAALVLLDARVLFSKKKVTDIFDPVHRPKRGAVERHHLFPKAYLKKAFGVTGIKAVNQIANSALVEWDDNVAISAGSPKEYAQRYAARFKGKELAEMYYWHALPPDWHDLTYDQLLEERGRLIAKVIKDGFYRLAGQGREPEPAAPEISRLIAAGEGPKIEFKSTVRTNLKTNQPDPEIEQAVLKTVAGFMNAQGGVLLVGVADDGKVLGLGADGFQNDDKMMLYLIDKAKARLGPHNAMFLEVKVDSVNGGRVMAVHCLPASKPVFLSDKSVERFYVRTLSSTTELKGSDAQHYISERF